MRRSDLATGIHVDPGYYVLDGDEGDPRALVVQGPFPLGDQGQVQARAWGEQLAKRTGRPMSLVVVMDLPQS